MSKLRSDVELVWHDRRSEVVSGWHGCRLEVKGSISGQRSNQ